MELELLKGRLEGCYRCYNRREYVHPDPLEFLYPYRDLRDREVVALISSSLAYGRVEQILKSVAWVLGNMTDAPRRFLMKTDRREMERIFSGFRHRFTKDCDLVLLLFGVARVIKRYGSLYEAFLAGYSSSHDSFLPALSTFVETISQEAGDWPTFLLPHPAKGGACKRLHLFLRWMVRKDDVDPGGWEDLPASKLIVPLDTHMHRVSRLLGFTRYRQAHLKAALEATRAFAQICPQDPVRYDFVLTRWGIRPDMTVDELKERMVL